MRRGPGQTGEGQEAVVEAVGETVGEDPISAGEAVIKIGPIFRKGKMTVSVSLHGEVFCS
jgi:hypothetical protein